MEINFNDINLEQVRDEVNLILWENNYPIESMQLTNKLIERLKNAKITFN